MENGLKDAEKKRAAGVEKCFKNSYANSDQMYLEAVNFVGDVENIYSFINMGVSSMTKDNPLVS